MQSNTPQPAAGAGAPARVALVPAATVTCALLTALTVASALFPAHELMTPALRTLYTATLYVCFVVIRRRCGLPRTSAFRLVEVGFLLLSACFAIGAAVRLLRTDADPEAIERTLMALEQGPGFLLGVSLLSYGIVLFIAELLQQHARLHDLHTATKGELKTSEHARRSMEQRLLEAEALRAVGELAAGVAHDLRNPLAIVKAAVEGLRAPEPDAGDTAAMTSERIAVIQRNLARADATIEALLDVGRTRPVAPAPVLLDELLADALEIVGGLASKRGVRTQVMPMGTITLAVERASTQRALVNLLSNAIEASAPEGVVSLRARRSPRGPPRIWLAVEDRGTGLPLQRERLFRPFFTTKKHGTGLGLLSARRILVAMGGNVRLYPRRGGGARALLALPRSCAVHVPAPAPAALAAAGAGAGTGAGGPSA